MRGLCWVRVALVKATRTDGRRVEFILLRDTIQRKLEDGEGINGTTDEETCRNLLAAWVLVFFA